MEQKFSKQINGDILVMRRNRKRSAITIIAAAILCLSSPAFAGDFSEQVINLITFGSDSTHNVDDTSLISTISRTLNLIALSVMAWLAVIGGTKFVIHTANKGVPGGQIISSFWMPIRISVATILLVPLTNGYSSIQYGVMSVAKAGIAAANNVQKSGLNYVAEHGVMRSPFLADSKNIVLGWITSEACRQYINSYQGYEVVTPHLNQQTSLNSIKLSYSYDVNETPGTREKADPRLGYCGSISIDMPRDFLPDNAAFSYVAPSIIQARYAELLAALQSEASAIASMILSDETSLRQLQRSGSSAQTAYESASWANAAQIDAAASRFIQLANRYDTELNSIIATSINQVSTDTSGTSWQNEIKTLGWAATGSMYWTITKQQERINALAKSLEAVYQQPQLDQHYSTDERFIELSLRIRGLQKFALSVQETPVNSNIVSISNAGVDGSGDFVKKFFAEVSSNISRSCLFDSTDGDVISSLQFCGSMINTTVDTAIHAIILGKV